MRVGGRKMAWWLLAVLAVAVVWHAGLLGYAIRQGVGQLMLAWKARPVEEVLRDPSEPDSLKAKLRLVQEIRRFAIDSLGLKDTKSYRTLYNQQGREVLWVVTACKPFEFTEKRWKFPVVGEVPYKGFFNPAHAAAEKRKLEAEGWEVMVRNPGGWSTLGWFPDPLLSNMLFRSEGDLASLIIHEMVHATLYVKDSADLNENLASFIGDRGAACFLKAKYGPSNPALVQYLEEDAEYRKLAGHILRGYCLLDSLYAHTRHLNPNHRAAVKQQTIRAIISHADTLQLKYLRSPARVYTDSLPNNAWFMNYRRYQARQDAFVEEYNKKFKGNLRAYVSCLKTRYPSP
ncbi:MAG: aminopeptidase [Cyclobacteriaceae bacterium]|nr:MAG: aminopeptidase [Cyclobacteriaceae bacterium]